MSEVENWEHTTVDLLAATLHPPHARLDKHELARRLSEAIIDAVQEHKQFGWELVNMEFRGETVSIHFRRPLHAAQRS